MASSAPRPFWADSPIRSTRRGQFWIPGEDRTAGDGHVQSGPMFVEWEAPEEVTRSLPIVLVHGGAFQGTEWLDTPDGRPGWAQRFVEAGYVTLVVDRPGHGRSPFHVDVLGAMSPPFTYEEGRHVFYPGDLPGHTQWPYDPADTAAEAAFIAGFGPLPADLPESERMDADRLAVLLDRIGPAFVITHSASGPDGWLLADRRPDLVRAIVSVEPMGPPFNTIHGIGTLAWGVTAAPMTFEPPLRDPAAVAAADPASRRLPNLEALPVAVVTGGASHFAAAAAPTVEFLRLGGARAEVLHLPDFGVEGNGHGLIYELNSDDAIVPVLEWLERLDAGGAA